MLLRITLMLLLLSWHPPTRADAAAVASSEPAEVAALRSDRSQSAETLLAKLETWGKAAPTPLAGGWAKLAMGEFYDELEQPDRAYELLNAAVSVADSEGARDLSMAANSRLASMYANRGDSTRAAGVLEVMEGLARQSGRRDWQALWAYNRGVMERKLGQFPEAMQFFAQSAEDARAGGDTAQQARALNALGLVLARTGKFADALSKHNEALDLARRTGDQAEIARTYRMLGFLHRNLDDEELAAQNIREALTHLGPRDVREGIALRGELSRSLLKMGQVDEAARFGEEASEAAMSLGSPPNKVNSFTALSDVRLAQGRVDDADLWSRRAAEQFNSVAIRDQVQIHANRTRVAGARGDFKTALSEARATVDGARKLGDKVLERGALDELSDIELATGDAMAAMATRKAFQQLDKNLAIDVAGRRVAILEGNLAAQRAESQRALLVRDNQIQTLRLARQRLLGIALIVGFCALAVFVVILFRRVRETQRLHAALVASAAELERVASTDALTGVANRGAVTAQFEQLLAQSQSGSHALAVLLIDIDHFKKVNDYHGHLAGDAVLREAAQRMRAALPDSARFGRWGGEEFIAILPGIEPAEVNAIAERVRVVVAATPFRYDTHEMTVSISIGVATAPRPERRGIDRLIATADAALYRAKHGGRNRVETG
ncbi:MAG: GGDEF domain-containing protein [Xanthomonadales bacterium]|nr:GGDEF domain-containing protein [Xanthomonadales bacterium]MBP7624298.1 GGDEF domain-containing protein [Xanthomonadales bacterium]